MWSNCALRSGCFFEPSSALRLYWREKPSFTSSLRTVSALIGCPMAVRIAANLSMLFDTHSSGRMGSPSVAVRALQCGHETGISRGDSLAASAGTPHLTFRQFLAIEIVLAAIDGRTGKPGDPRDHRKPAPAGRSHLARREHPPPAFVKLRADHVPAIANRVFIDHANRETIVRLDRDPDAPTRRPPAHRDSLIVRGGLRPRPRPRAARARRVFSVRSASSQLAGRLPANRRGPAERCF